MPQDNLKDSFQPGSLSASAWEPWFSTGALTFSRKLVHEMGFDGVIQLHEIACDDASLNEALRTKLFCDFHHVIEKGIFLRQIRSPEAWPETTLVFLDYTLAALKELVQSDSSFLAWPVRTVSAAEFVLLTQHSRKPARGFRINHAGEIVLRPFPAEER